MQTIYSDVNLCNINSTRLHMVNYFLYQTIYTVDDVREWNNIEVVLPNTEEDDLSVSTDNEDNDTGTSEKEYISATQAVQFFLKSHRMG